MKHIYVLSILLLFSYSQADIENDLTSLTFLFNAFGYNFISDDPCNNNNDMIICDGTTYSIKFIGGHTRDVFIPDIIKLDYVSEIHVENYLFIMGLQNILTSTELKKVTFKNLYMLNQVEVFTNIATLELSHLTINNCYCLLNLGEILTSSIPITHLDLSFNLLHGELPDPSLLPNLEYLNLANNNFSGSIPYFQYPNIKHLFLSRNPFISSTIPNIPYSSYNFETISLNSIDIHGELPSSLFQAPNLHTVELINTNISGSLPSNIATNPNLKQFHIYSDELSPVTEFPSVLLENQNMIGVTFGSINYVGELPENICDIAENLEEFNVIYSRLYGEIPSSIADCNNLKILRLISNGDLGGDVQVLNELQNLEILYLSSNKFNDDISFILDHPNLIELNLEENDFEGVIPTEILQLSNLEYFNIRDNNIDGIIPSQIGQLTKLKEFIASKNSIEGKIPSTIKNLVNLVNLDLGENIITGEIPKELGEVISLEYISLDGNQLNGAIPKELGNLPSLKSLRVDRNNLSGPIPEELGDLNSLILLMAHKNHLSGSIPESFKDLSNLQYLVLENNDLDGKLDVLTSMSSLLFLSLGSNKFKGEIPNGFSLMAELNLLSLRNNSFTGKLPSDIGEYSKEMKFLDLSFNQLSGTISSSITELENMEYLFLNNNNFTGSLPSDIDKMKNLAQFAVLNNKLSGSIPESLYDNEKLELLALSMNNFTGTISTKLSQLTNLKFLLLGSNKFEGDIPDIFDDLENLTILDLSMNRFSSIPNISNSKLEHIWLTNNFCLFNDNQCPILDIPSTSYCDFRFTPFNYSNSDCLPKHCITTGKSECTRNNMIISEKYVVYYDTVLENDIILTFKDNNISTISVNSENECLYTKHLSQMDQFSDDHVDVGSCSCIDLRSSSIIMELNRETKKGDEYEFEIVNGCYKHGSINSINVVNVHNEDDNLCYDASTNNNDLSLVMKIKVNSCKKSLWWIALIVIGVVVVAFVVVAILATKVKAIRDVIFPFRKRGEVIT